MVDYNIDHIEEMQPTAKKAFCFFLDLQTSLPLGQKQCETVACLLSTYT